MNPYPLIEAATEDNFSEEAYLDANPDVAKAVKEGIHLLSGKQHYDIFGKAEGRNIRLPISVIALPKLRKLERIKPFLRADMSYSLHDGLYNFLNDDMRLRYNIVETDAVSSNNYDERVNNIINEYQNGLILDCGSGRRDLYYENVLNFDIVNYDSTDVVGVGEMLPFIDNTFDAVFSLSVLEHVKDPFLCAKEIARVLKPGGKLICSVPFLQPYHAYPHHYYNMTSKGIENLFSAYLEIDNIDISLNEHPIWSLTWLLRNWSNGLTGETKEIFLQTKIGDLIETGDRYLEKNFVQELSAEKKLELAYATVILAHKK